jgi:POT family proton-dependent oligopeptide transporter
MFKRHPKGLAVLFFTEMWERFGFYTLMAILVLYMDREMKWSDAHKGDIYGLFLLLCYVFPIVGGWLGDKVLGPKKTVRLGASMMAVGYACLTASSAHRVGLFYLGCLLVAVGTGIFKVNISVSVGNLYSQNDERKDAAFNIYYMGVNIGATAAPLAATAISVAFNSYNLSFAAAALGMMICILIFEGGQKQLTTHDASAPMPAEASVPQAASNKQEDRQRLATLFTLFAIVIFFWIAFYQNGFAMTLFAERSTVKLSYLRPETYQFFNPFFILVLTPPLLSLFGKMRAKGKEPSSPRKIFLGMFVCAFSMAVMVVAAFCGGDRDQNIMSPLWLVLSYFFVTNAEILVSPMGLSFVSKVAPRKMQGLMMGFWFCATALGSYGSGLMGRFYSSFSHHSYYMLLTALLVFAAGLVLLFYKRLNQFTA